MNGLTGLFTSNGKPIYSTEYVEKLRDEEEKKKVSRFFIAQKGAQENDLHSTVDILVTGGNRGGGKANPYYTKVMTPSGFRQIGDLQIGDKICTPYEGIQEVSGIFDQGENTVYVFHLDDGTEVRCMDNHRFYARSHPDEPFMIWTARDIMELYRLDQKPPFARRSKVDFNVEIPICGEVEMDETKVPSSLPIHPYLLSYTVYNGYNNFDGLKVLSRRSFESNTFSMLGYKIRKHPYKQEFYITGFTKQQKDAVVRTHAGNPVRITEEYMTSSIQSRWYFLRGLFLRQGKAKNNHPCYESTNKAFVEDVAQMARSLGAWVSVSEITDDPKKAGMWRASMLFQNDKRIWPCTRRATQAKENYDKVSSCPVKPGDPCYTKKILWVSKAQKKTDCRCITVTGNDHLYMTDAFTINHNTALMLMEGLYDIDNRHFNSVLFRKNKDDFDNIENESRRWFDKLGKYNKSKDDMTWNFKTGAKMSFDTYDMDWKDFDAKYRGQQFAYIGIDELPQMPFEYLKILMGSNRNTIGVRSRILGTCNPDPLSWLRPFLDWWIGKEDTVYSDGLMHPERKGLPIPERDGVVRYCFMGNAESVDGIIWGDTPEEVYEQCKSEIDARWDPSLEEFGYNKMTFAVKSVTFIKASIQENKALLKNDPGYIASILNKSPEEVAKEWDGNWDVIKTSDDLIKPYHMDRIFGNAKMTGDGIRRATCDVAGDGGDNCVTWLWIGWHVADIFVCRRDLYTTPTLLKAKLEEWGVLEQNLAYDLNGVGQVLKGAFPNAVKFNNEEAVDPKYKFLYNNKKSQCAYKFAERTQQEGWSIEYSLLTRRYKMGKDTRYLRDILQIERKCVKQDMSKADRGWCIIPKEHMKKRDCVGHSPDFFEALFMREIFELKSSSVSIPSFLRNKMVHRRVISSRRIIST
jgi:hypothetical protein